MNERIKELAEQAEWHFADKTTGNFSEYDRRLEKFAELIWKEAYDQGYWKGVSDSSEGQGGV